MRKKINKFLIPTMLSGLSVTTGLSNCNVISNNVNTLRKAELTSKNIENYDKQAIDHFINTQIKEDCLINFQKYYRLKASKFNFINHENIVYQFQNYINRKYNCGAFTVNSEASKWGLVLTDGLNKVKINISVKNKKKEIITKHFLDIHINMNDFVSKIVMLYEKQEYSWDFKKEEGFKNEGEVISHYNNELKETYAENYLDVEFVSSNKPHYLSNIRDYDLEKHSSYACLKIKQKDYFSPSFNVKLAYNPEIKQYYLDRNEEIYFYFTIFIEEIGEQNDAKTFAPVYLIDREMFDRENYTYQNYVDFLRYKFIEEMTYIKKWQKIDDKNFACPFKSIKLVENQNKIFTHGKHILKLLIAKNKNYDEYIEYNLPVFWADVSNKVTWEEYKIIEKKIFQKYNYPNSQLIENNYLRKDQSQKEMHDFLLEKIKCDYYTAVFFSHLPKDTFFKHFIYVKEFYEKNPQITISLEFVNPEKLFEEGHNMVSTIVEINEFKFPIDFHINIINSEQII